MLFHQKEFHENIFTRLVHFGGGTENCRMVVGAVFPLETTRGRRECSKNTGQTLGTVLPIRGL